MERFQSLLAIPILIGIAFLLSNDRKNFPWRVVLWGIALQIIFAVLILWTPWGRDLFAVLGELVTKFLGFATEGSAFLFGNMVKPEYQFRHSASNSRLQSCRRSSSSARSWV